VDQHRRRDRAEYPSADTLPGQVHLPVAQAQVELGICVLDRFHVGSGEPGDRVDELVAQRVIGDAKRLPHRGQLGRANRAVGHPGRGQQRG
jgi:hypothetical protein